MSPKRVGFNWTQAKLFVKKCQSLANSKLFGTKLLTQTFLGFWESSIKQT